MPIDNETLGAAVAIAKANPASEQAITNAVEDWLDDHPEATTTVQDGSITKAKLDNNLQVSIDEVGQLKSALNDIGRIITVDIAVSDLANGEAWNAQNNPISANNCCRYVNTIDVSPGDIVVAFNSPSDTRLGVISWLTFTENNTVSRYGYTPVCHVADGEAYIKVNFSTLLLSTSEGRSVNIYKGYSAIPVNEMQTALSFGNPITLTPDFINGYGCGSDGAWGVRNTTISVLLDIPFNAISVTYGLTRNAAATTYPHAIFFNEDYAVILTNNTDLTIEIPANARHVVFQSETASTDLGVSFKISDINAASVNDKVTEEAEKTSILFTDSDVSLIDYPVGMTGVGLYDTERIGKSVRYNSNTGWHWQRFAVNPGDIIAYNLENPTNHNNYIMLADATDTSMYIDQGKAITGQITIPNNAAWLYVSLRSNATSYSVIKKNAEVVNMATLSTTDGISAFLGQLQAELEVAGVSLTLNPVYYYTEHGDVLGRLPDANLKFAILSDTHYKNDGTQPEFARIAKALKRLQDAGEINFAVHLGDGIENGTYSYPAFSGVLADAGVQYMALRGNHDLVEPSIIRTNCTNMTGIVFDTMGCWAYLDDDANNIRYVFLNACDKGIDDENDTNTITMQQSDFSWAQLNWLANTALKTSKTVILFNHASLPTGTTDPERVMMSTVGANYYSAGIIVNAFIQGTSGSVEYTNAWSESGAQATVSYDFTTQGAGDALCLFHGHGHGDWNHVNEYGLLDIMESNALCVNNMSASWGYSPLAVRDTIREVAFDLVRIDLTNRTIDLIRFGRGYDRSLES